MGRCAGWVCCVVCLFGLCQVGLGGGHSWLWSCRDLGLVRSLDFGQGIFERAFLVSVMGFWSGMHVRLGAGGFWGGVYFLLWSGGFGLLCCFGFGQVGILGSRAFLPLVSWGFWDGVRLCLTFRSCFGCFPSWAPSLLRACSTAAGVLFQGRWPVSCHGPFPVRRRLLVGEGGPNFRCRLKTWLAQAAGRRLGSHRGSRPRELSLDASLEEGGADGHETGAQDLVRQWCE